MSTAEADFQMSANELRVRVYEFADQFSGVVEEAADKIIAQSSDPEIRRQALLWKMRAIPAVQKAVFQPDALGALIDAWALTAQMTQYFTRGAGKDAFGQWQHIAIEASQQLERDVVALAQSAVVSGDVTRGQEFVDAWVRQHPMTSPLFVRESTIGQWADVTAEGGTSTFAAVSTIEGAVIDLQDRLKVYAEQLPKQARWQAELLVGELIENGEIGATLENVSRLTESMGRVTAIVEQGPDIIAGERVATLNALHAELGTIVDEVDEQRVATFKDVRNERIALMDAIRQERIETMNVLRAERVAITEAIGQERIATMADLSKERVAALEEIEAITMRVLGASASRVNGALDRVFWRGTQLLAAVLVVGLITVVVATRKRGKRER